MLYRALADLVVLVHLSFIVFALFGGILALRWRWIPWAHLPAVAWGAAVELFGWICPLTPLENRFRLASGAAGYSGSFVERYLVPVVYPEDLNRPIQLVLGCALLAFNLGVYGLLWRRARRRRAAKEGGAT